MLQYLACMTALLFSRERVESDGDDDDDGGDDDGDAGDGDD